MKCYLGQGEFTDHPFGMDGGIATTRVPRLRALMRFVTQNGVEHHVAMVRGHHADVVQEAVQRYLRWPFYHHGGTPEPTLTHPTRFQAQMVTHSNDPVLLQKPKAIWMRRRAFAMVHKAQLGHPGGDFSAIDIIDTL